MNSIMVALDIKMCVYVHGYSTSPEYPECEVWLEISTCEIRILNENYEEIAVHKRKYAPEIMPVIDFENHVGTLARKPRAFLSSPYFAALPISVQEHLKKCTYPELKKMLITLVPIIRDNNHNQLRVRPLE